MGLCRNFTVLGPAEIFSNPFFSGWSKLTLCSDRGLLKVARLCKFPYQLACNLSFSRKKIVVVVAVMELISILCCWPFVVGWNVLMSHLLHNPHNTLRIFSFLQKELQNLEDAGDELMMLDDDTTPIPYPFSNFYHIYLPLQFKWLFFSGGRVVYVYLSQCFCAGTHSSTVSLTGG